MLWNKLLLAAALVSANPAIGEMSVPDERGEPTRRAVERLQAESAGTLVVEWNSATGTPGLLAGRLTEPSRHSPQWIAVEFLKRFKTLYGLKRVEEQLAIVGVESGPADRTTVILQRRLYGKPVCGDQLTVEMDKTGVVVQVAGTIHADLEKKRLYRPMYPAVTREEAAAAASRYTNGHPSAEAARVQACYLPDREGIPLIYTVSFFSGLPGDSATTIRVHSLTGRVIE